MRSRTRNVIIGLVVVAVLLLALGAVPGLLKTGDPYYVTATPVGSWDGPNATVDDNATAVNASSLVELRYPYTQEALGAVNGSDAGQSEPYWKGPLGIKETFTHSPFDEMTALTENNPQANAAEGGVYVHDNRTVYLLAVTQDGQ